MELATLWNKQGHKHFVMLGAKAVQCTFFGSNQSDSNLKVYYAVCLIIKN
jgi:hypothetical protein